MSKFVVLFILAFGAKGFAGGEKCYPAANMKYSYKMKPAQLKSKFCVDEKSDFIINQECSVSSNCLAMKSQNVPQTLIYHKSDIGSPGHRICQILKAVPIIVKYKTTGEWKETSICLFPDDSFINIDYMMKYNIKAN